ncbi:hypothetical protein BCR34DRAFT_590786 [Clohesyomyces aquaticus]|uniref:AN1-type domain-containing protein n=1 Tax=Clohesyomyces aquaticus TaxID=1231657 RepID=A0A1Y1Z6C0_9PLEO|nr:hypothetical protein BCR34DRAFT_590786 [Clohesyomyces aquaticus]
MSKGDVDAIGAHCQMAYCHVLDFLPFKCNACEGVYCLDHRTEAAHTCSKAADKRRPRSPNGPSPVFDERQCADPACKTLISVHLTTGVRCTTCNRSYCLKHRMGEDHNCKNLIPIGARPSNAFRRQRDQGISALSKLKAWAENKRAEDRNKKIKTLPFGFGKLGKSASSSSTAMKETNDLKKAAKGDASVPQDKRIYLNVEASADTTKSKYPSGKFFYNKEWTVGRVLDAAAKSLQVENVNNRGGGEEEKLRVFHVEGGRLLRFNEKIGGPCATGNMIVLLRGVGEPDLIDL